jgi:hypothetical protein
VCPLYPRGMVQVLQKSIIGRFCNGVNKPVYPAFCSSPRLDYPDFGPRVKYCRSLREREKSIGLDVIISATLRVSQFRNI